MGAPSPADAHDACACGAHHEVTAAGGSSIIEFAGAAPRRPKTCPNATRNACAFRVRASDPGARITSISGTPATRRRRVGGNGGPPLKASPLRLCAATEGARCAARLKSLRRKPPTPQELEERTSGSPTCRRVRGGFSIPPFACGAKAHVASMDAGGHESVLS